MGVEEDATSDKLRSRHEHKIEVNFFKEDGGRRLYDVGRKKAKEMENFAWLSAEGLPCECLYATTDLFVQLYIAARIDEQCTYTLLYELFKAYISVWKSGLFLV